MRNVHTFDKSLLLFPVKVLIVGFIDLVGNRFKECNF